MSALGEALRALAEHVGVTADDQAMALPPGIVNWAHGERHDGVLLREPSTG